MDRHGSRPRNGERRLYKLNDVKRYDGPKTGQVAEGQYRIMVYAMEEFPCRVYVDVVQLKYGQLEETMVGELYRHTLGDTVFEQDIHTSAEQYWVALQADRAVAPDEISLLPPALHHTVQTAWGLFKRNH